MKNIIEDGVPCLDCNTIEAHLFEIFNKPIDLITQLLEGESK